MTKLENCSIYLYAFCNKLTPPLELPKGLRHAVEIVSEGDLSALVELGLALEDCKQDDEQLLLAVVNHDRVIQELFQQTTVIPLRFGTCLGFGNLVAHLRKHQSEYLAKIAKFAGKAEYTLKLTSMPLPELEPTPIPSNIQGREYFLAKKQRYQTQLAQQQQQVASIQALTQAIAQTYPDIIPGVARGKEEVLHLLVNRQEELLLYQNLQLWQAQYPQWQLHLETALPPYHFL